MRHWLLLWPLLASCTNFDSLDRDWRDRDLGIDAAVRIDDLSVARDESMEPPTLDLYSAPDIGPNCNDQLLGGGETDIDCGDRCPPCNVGKVCDVDTDCQTGACISNHCELASSPPNWLVVGTAATGTTPPIARNDLVVGQGPDGLVYAMGGLDSVDESLDTVERFDPAAGWTTSSNLAHHRDAAAVAASSTALYVLYGDNNGTPQANVEKMSTPPTFASIGGLSDMRVAGGAAVGSDGRVYVFGGNDGTSTLATAESFAPGGTTLTMLSPLTTARQSFGAAVGGDGRIYAAGGMPSATATAGLTTVEAYSIATTIWSAVTALPEERAYAPAVLAPDNRIYFIGGGAPGAGRIRSSVVAYRAVTSTTSDSWISTADLQQPRWHHGAAVGPDGRIYVVAGSGLLSMLRTTEAYGPVMTLGTTSGNAAAPVQVSGSNFAANAVVSITFGAATGPVIGNTTTDAAGTLSTVLAQIPSDASAGPVRLYATDDRSRYPVSAAYSVTP